MTTLPTVLHIGHQRVSVVEVDGLVDERGAALHGLYDPDNTTISLQAKLQPGLQAETLIHEVLHAIYYNWALNHDARKMDEEEIVSRVSLGLAAVFAANGHLLDYLHHNLVWR